MSLSLREAIFASRANSCEDDIFIDEINKLASKNGEITYQEVFHVLSNLDLSVADAKELWNELISHRIKMSSMLGRPINLTSAMADFLICEKKTLHCPKLVEVKAYEKVVKESTHDSLTGLHNRQFLSDALDQQISAAKRHNTLLTILYLDIDDFKEINDTYGHQAGDEVLKSIVQVIQQEKRSSDIASRYGGEEFVIVMPNTDTISALVLAERIRESIELKNHPIGNDQTVRLTVSGGLASFPSDADTPANLLHLADSALYRAKGAGKNNISLFKDDKRRFLRIELKHAVQVKELGFSNKQESYTGTSKNICIGGILFENREPLNIGANIQLSIPINNRDPLLLIGTVVRVEAFGPQSYDIGMTIAFKEMEKTAKDEISRFLVKQSKQQDVTE